MTYPINAPAAPPRGPGDPVPCVATGVYATVHTSTGARMMALIGVEVDCERVTFVLRTVDDFDGVVTGVTLHMGTTTGLYEQDPPYVVSSGESFRYRASVTIPAIRPATATTP